MALTKQERRDRIKKRIRKVVNGTPEAPRLSVFRSNKQIYAQIVDDISGKTLTCASSLEKDIVSATGTKTEKAALVGKLSLIKLKQSISKELYSIVTDIYITGELNQLLMQPVREALNSKNYDRKY
jgi:large subunit ribosomal protein L18